MGDEEEDGKSRCPSFSNCITSFLNAIGIMF